MTDAEALKLIPFVRHSYNTKNFTKDSYTAGQWFGTVENALKQKAERRGRWIHLTKLDAFECSVCGRQMVRNIFDYCPWCGARMDGEEE